MNFNKTGYVFLVMGVLLLFSGCVTTQEQRAGQLQMQVDRQEMSFRVDKLEAQIYDQAQGFAHLQQQQELLRAEIRRLESALAAQRRDSSEALATERAIREREHQEMIDELSRRMAGLIASQRPAATSRSRGETGYEHVVKPGETLSQIAAAYRVTVDAIVRANELRNPDNVRAGQKLFIPE